MAASPANWVPDGAWLAPGYAEWAPPPALRPAVACLWARVVPDGDGTSRGSLIVPDGCSDLIWERGSGTYVAGPDTGPTQAVTPAGTVLAGVRFRPGAGGSVLGVPLSEIRDQRVDLADLLTASRLSRAGLAPARACAFPARRAVERSLAPDLDPAAAAARLLDLASRLVTEGDADAEVTRATALLRDPATRVEQIAAQVDLSDRQLRRRFHAAAGYGPKTLQRVLRFQRFVRRLDACAGHCDLAAVAAEAGYADQAHLTRECAALSGLPPAALARERGH